jgi:SAM-dependent methyltransferase
VRDDVNAYYASGAEDDRLAAGIGALEFERTKELLVRFLSPRSRIADIGGGTGRYAEWLTLEGHEVELVEPLLLHVELARERAGDPPRFGVHGADARELPFADGVFDVVLLLGPLYHLGERADRQAAIVEARRICREGGLVVAAAISRFAPLLDMIRRGKINDPRVLANVEAETREGRRVSPERRTSAFPDAYFHRPEELEEELTAARLRIEGVFGIEGPGWLHPGLEELWDDAAVREAVLRTARAVESDAAATALSAHLLIVGTKDRD